MCESVGNYRSSACGNKPGSLVRAEQPFWQWFKLDLVQGLPCGCCMFFYNLVVTCKVLGLQVLCPKM